MGFIELDQLLGEVEEEETRLRNHHRWPTQKYNDDTLLLAKCCLHVAHEVYKLRTGDHKE